MDNNDHGITRYFGDKACSHCCKAAYYVIDGEGWLDYECEAHTQEWWEFEYDMYQLAITTEAAYLEYMAAERDFTAAFEVFNTDRTWGTPRDRAVTSTAGYADAAYKVYSNMVIG